MIEQTLRTWLLADPAVAAMINGNRLYPQVVPPTSPLPAVAYMVLNKTPIYHQGGVSGLAVINVRWICLARTYVQVRDLANAVEAAVNGYVGVVDTYHLTSFVTDLVETFNQGISDLADSYQVNIETTIYYREII